MTDELQRLKGHLARVRDLEMAAAVLRWDLETYMPAGGTAARARQLGTLSELSHELFTDDAVGGLLDALAPYATGLDSESDDASLIRVTRRLYEKERRVPAELVGEIARVSSLGRQAWEKARQESNFAIFQPHLEELLDLRVQWANCFEYQDTIYDPMLDDFEPGLGTAEVRAVLDAVRGPLVEIVQAIGERQGRVDVSCLKGDFDVGAQATLGVEALQLMGFDFERGRQDVSAHPFTTRFSSGDVRITTRFDPQDLVSAFFGTVHEGGHALYEMGVSPALDAAVLGEGASAAVHESQSRLYENVVGRSRHFWRFFYPRLQARFEQFAGVDLETFYRAINRVQPSLIRVEADEVTYGLHIILRFELEEALVTGGLQVANLPTAWNAKMEAYLGVTPANDAQGVLQDVHWAEGYFGYFPSYLLGSMLAVQLFEKAREEMPDLPSQIESGHCEGLLGWLRENVHIHGRKFTLEELTARVLGRSVSPAPYLCYLEERYGEIYGL